MVSHGSGSTPRTGASATVTVARRCYAVGQKVSVSGRGFAVSAPYDLSVDGIDFGQSLTDAGGAFTIRFSPGGLGAGQAELADTLEASDGTSTASTRFTLTRPTGALIGATAGSSPRRLVPFEVWDFAPHGPQTRIYLHYVDPAGHSRAGVALGTTHGQCGALSSARHQLFPFNPSRGTWTLQFDTARGYSPTVAGKVARLRIGVG